LKEKTFIFNNPYEIVKFHDFMHNSNIKYKKIIIEYEEEEK